MTEVQTTSASNIIWDSAFWYNHVGRKIKSGDLDKYDKYLQVLKTKNAKAHINGRGLCTVNGDDIKLYIHTHPNILFQNMRMTASVFVKGVVSEISLCVRSNHQDRPNGFGGYYLCIDYPSQLMYIRKEVTHIKGYSDRLQCTPIELPKETWARMMLEVNNCEDNKVKLYAQFLSSTNKLHEIFLEDDGHIKCGFDNDTAPFLKKGKWCFLKAINAEDLQYKDIRIEDINSPREFAPASNPQSSNALTDNLKL